MAKRLIDVDTILNQAKPLTHQHAHEIQPFGHIVKLPIALAESVCKESVENLNQLLADTMTLRDLYKKHHWQVAGPTFYQLHLLFDKHHDEQNELVDTIAERIQLLGGVSIAMAHDVAETTLIPRAPKGPPRPAQGAPDPAADGLRGAASRRRQRAAGARGAPVCRDAWPELPFRLGQPPSARSVSQNSCSIDAHERASASAL